MMLIEKLNKSKSKINILSQCDIMASYDFFTTIVSLDSLDSEDIKKLMECRDSISESLSQGKPISFNTYAALSKIQPLVTHEYTHFYDCCSTVWGARYLSMMSSAYMADNRAHGGTEKDFHHAKKFHDLLRFSRLPSYYTYKTSTTDISRPWTHYESMGNRFSNTGEVSDYPIVFSWFGNHKGEKIVRSPISTISILECSAMAQEIDSHIGLISLLSDGEMNVESSLYTKKLLDYIYNKDLTEYSVCAHLLANKYKEPDILYTYQASAILCRIVLNTPSTIYNKIAVDCDFNALFGATKEAEAWIEKIRKGLSYLEPGILYYLICYAMPDGKLSKSDDVMPLIHSGFKRLSINYIDLQNESKIEFSKYSNLAAGSKIESIVKIAQAGQANYQRSDWSKSKIDFFEMNIPPALLGDSVEINIFSGDKNSLHSLSLNAVYDELVNGQLWVEKFVEACA